MSLLHSLEQLLGGHAPQPAPTATPQPSTIANGRQLLSVKGGAGVDTPSLLQYAPPRTPTPQFSLPQSNLERYGDSQGNQWFENPDGQRFAMPKAPQNFDAPVSSLHYQPIRPHATGYLPVNDATVHMPQPQMSAVRFF